MDRRTIDRKAVSLRRDVMAFVQQRFPDAANPRDYLHPKYAAEFLGYAFEERGDLDLELRSVDDAARKKVGVITGLLDRKERKIAVSERFSPAEKRFAGAHELGHLRLHPFVETIHRDRLPKGSRTPRSRTEVEADWFAATYLMPKKWIERDVEEKYGERPIRVGPGLLWWLSPDDPDRFELPSADELDVEKAIATCTNIGSGHFVSLADEYGVSVEAMARRLRELNLVEIA